MSDFTFNGELKGVEPNKLINKNGPNNQFSNFFLVLGQVFNDLKSISFYYLTLKQEFEKYGDLEQATEVSNELGEYHGMKNHLLRLMSSTIYEFLLFLKENIDIIQSENFKKLEKNLNKSTQKALNDLIFVATEKGKNSNRDSFIQNLCLIRNVGTYHYYRALKPLKQGYIEHFFVNQENHEGNKKAYYSTGNTPRETRFFFSDAATSGYNKIKIKEYTSPEVHLNSLFSVVERTNFVISNIMSKYITMKRNNQI